MIFTQILRRKLMLRSISGSRVPSRLGADAASTPPPPPPLPAAAAAAAAAVPGLEYTKGSAPGATSGSRVQVISG